MLPIGIVTRDRVAYLDVTLRSLSATAVPGDVPVCIYDDGSTDPRTRSYYETNQPVPVNQSWPTDQPWDRAGLHVIQSQYRPPCGINGLLRVVRSQQSQGVVQASCAATCDLFDTYQDSPAIILLQDDIVFKHHWWEQLLTTADRIPDLGVLAGLKLNQILQPGRGDNAVQSGITAQCLYISRRAFLACQPYFRNTHQDRTRFDDTLRRAVAAAGLWAGCTVPFVCQHFGVTSQVRPNRRWNQHRTGRIGYHVRPPYAMADRVRDFSGETS